MQKPYIQEANELVNSASVAVQILLGDDGKDVEFVPMRPQMAGEEWWAEIRNRWHGRGLRSIGVLAMTEDGAQSTFKEPISLDVINRLATAFQVYCLTLASSGLPQPEYDWSAKRYIN